MPKHQLQISQRVANPQPIFSSLSGCNAIWILGNEFILHCNDKSMADFHDWVPTRHQMKSKYHDDAVWLANITVAPGLEYHPLSFYKVRDSCVVSYKHELLNPFCEFKATSCTINVTCLLYAKLCNECIQHVFRFCCHKYAKSFFDTI